MKHTITVMTMLVLMFSIGSSFVFAQEDTPIEPFTPADNECYEGGTMYREDPSDPFGCVSEWHWECGWYLARYNRGILDYEETPTWCNFAPPRPADPPAPTFTLPNTVSPPPQSCSGTYNTNTDTLSVSYDWGTPIAGQADIRWRVIYTTGQRDLTTNSVSANQTVAGFNGSAQTGSSNGTVSSVRGFLRNGNGNTIATGVCSLTRTP